MKTTPSSILTHLFVLVAVLLLFLAPDNIRADDGKWKAEVGQSKVTVQLNGEKVCVVKSGLLNVEETRFLKWEGKECLAVKSRDNHGPALLELFDAHTGALKDKVMAFAVDKGEPKWAAPWKE